MGEAPAIRGYFGRKFEDEVFMHNHEPDGAPIYQYPRVQFKVIDSMALMVGINEGSELLQRLWFNLDETRIGDERLIVLETQFESHSRSVEVTAEPITFRFATPWIALNQQNHRDFTGIQHSAERKAELARILVGNCLSLGKSLGIRFTDRIIADCSRLAAMQTTLKGRSMLGFFGVFTINVSLPNYIGLGKSVSRGFGTICQLATEK